jgi:hypothetical protein
MNSTNLWIIILRALTSDFQKKIGWSDDEMPGVSVVTLFSRRGRVILSNAVALETEMGISQPKVSSEL